MVDGGKVKPELSDVGEAGGKSLKRIESAFQPASAGLQIVSKAANDAFAQSEGSHRMALRWRGPPTCKACGTTCPECPYRLNAPQIKEDWQVLSVLDIRAVQLRMAQNTVIGLDFTAWMKASQALDADVCAMSNMFPAIEAGVTAGINQKETRAPTDLTNVG